MNVASYCEFLIESVSGTGGQGGSVSHGGSHTAERPGQAGIPAQSHRWRKV